MNKLFYTTFTRMSGFYGCILPVWARDEAQVVRLVKATYGEFEEIDKILGKLEGYTERQNRGLVLLDEIGVD